MAELVAVPQCGEVRMTYACNNRAPFAQNIRMQDGWAESETSRRPVMIEQPFVMAKDCRYTHTTLGQQDEKCQGCKWRVEVANG